MAESTTKRRLAVDVGGTFIDYVLLDETTGEVVVEKQPATASNLLNEFMTGIERLPVPLSEIELLIHGTTVALNTLVQLRGAKTGLLTTKGFRDVLELGRGGRPDMFDLQITAPEPLVERKLRREIGERLAADGGVVRPVDFDEVKREVDFLVGQGVKAVAITFLHSYKNPKHEQLVAEYVRSTYPDLSVSVSSELVREWREFERTSTTVINAFTQPHFAGYAGAVEAATRENGLANPIAFLRSNGGVMPISAAQRRPVDTLGSGPAGGVVGARALLAATPYRNGICADVGGTTYDVALIRDGEVVERSETIVEGRPIMGSVIDIVSVGAGGGSIASINPLSGTLKVGPESAGAHPGPACFGHGGTEPTVTDAQVILQMLDPDRFLGRRMTLDRERAEHAIIGALGDAASVVEHAAGIVAVAQANMANAIRQMTTQRGLDPREFVMISFGGGGGLFAAGVSEELGVRTVLVPPAAAGFSAWGMLTSDYREDATVTVSVPITTETYPLITRQLKELHAEATAALGGYGFPLDRVECSYSAEIRFAGQEHTLSTPVDAAVVEDDALELLGELPAQFAAQHRERYGHGDPEALTEVVTLRCRAIAPVVRPAFPTPPTVSEVTPVTSRDIWFPATGWCRDVPVYERADLGLGVTINGPAVVDEWTTTVIVPPAWNARIDQTGNLELTFDGKGSVR
ncbi:hydantoinase/oxoprolinase family protein [Nonomuraea phyllanthi]|uniref:hydantoinase/oxoprolinase family protein n=1 Tax=Nonomuraea phyllanthi TaxID=2219224 RepID=UPI001292F8D1|nr:hydantoinase/oxoprolinase family protein [Nonomuraea phyllanthi]QFY09866.1 hydantoinase/oxoprolinase family protein [Nonomuraea phyllanthi]